MISSNTKVKVRYDDGQMTLKEVEGFYNYMKDGILHLKDASGLERIMPLARIVYIDEVKKPEPPKEPVK